MNIINKIHKFKDFIIIFILCNFLNLPFLNNLTIYVNCYLKNTLLKDFLNPIIHILLIGLFTGLSIFLMSSISNKIISIIKLKYILFLDVGICLLILILFNIYNNIFLYFLIQLFMHCINNSLANKKINKDISTTKKDRIFVLCITLPIFILGIIFYFYLTNKLMKSTNIYLNLNINIIVNIFIGFIMKTYILHIPDKEILVLSEDIKINN